MNEDRASRYHRLRRRAALVWTFAGGAALGGFLLADGSRLLRDAAVTVTAAGPSAPSTVAVYALGLTLGYLVFRLPLSCYQALVLDRRYGLSSETLRVWALDYLKASLLTVVLGVGAAQIVYVTMRWWPVWWWIPAAGCLAAALVVLARLVPVALLPMFYRLESLERESLRARLAGLCDRARVPVLAIHVWGLGERSRRANAALVGAGATRRILVSDTLLADYSDDEIEVILAHELAHHVHGDIRRGLMVEAGLVLAALGAGALALQAWRGPFGLSEPADVAGLPLLVLTALLVSLAAAPAVNALSRRSERRADRYALALTGRPEAFVSAMRRLAAQNLAEERPSRLAVWLFHSHPPIGERIETARIRTRVRVNSSESRELGTPDDGPGTGTIAR